jgi:hypothetical protein
MTVLTLSLYHKQLANIEKIYTVISLPWLVEHTGAIIPQANLKYWQDKLLVAPYDPLIFVSKFRGQTRNAIFKELGIEADSCFVSMFNFYAILARDLGPNQLAEVFNLPESKLMEQRIVRDWITYCRSSKPGKQGLYFFLQSLSDVHVEKLIHWAKDKRD